MENEKNHNNSHLFVNRTIIAAIVLLLLIMICSFSYNNRAKKMNQNNCFSILSNSSADAARKINAHLTDGFSVLNMISSFIAQADTYDPEVISKILENYETNIVINNIGVLTSENMIITAEGTSLNSKPFMDFNTEAKKGSHLSGLTRSVFETNKKIIRGFMPVEKNNITTGLIFIELNADTAADVWTPEMYDGTAKFCVIERSTGSVLVNNSNIIYKNIAEIKNDDLIGESRFGKTGYMAFPINGHLTFASYQPLTVVEWEVIFFVDSDKALENSNRMKLNFREFMIEEAIIFLIFMILIFYFNKSSIKSTEKKANSDALTALPNRNMYEEYCQRKKNDTGDIACVYIDVNGLHEINNSQGHIAGDQMLRFVADTLKVAFNGAEIFRIGGDEFVIFQEKSSGSGINLKIRSVTEQLKKNNYYISTGICYGQDGTDISAVVKTAEKKMFGNKKMYYEKMGKQVRNDIHTPTKIDESNTEND